MAVWCVRVLDDQRARFMSTRGSQRYYGSGPLREGISSFVPNTCPIAGASEGHSVRRVSRSAVLR